jgi:hypothetical protein
MVKEHELTHNGRRHDATDDRGSCRSSRRYPQPNTPADTCRRLASHKARPGLADTTRGYQRPTEPAGTGTPPTEETTMTLEELERHALCDMLLRPLVRRCDVSLILEALAALVPIEERATARAIDRLSQQLKGR